MHRDLPRGSNQGAENSGSWSHCDVRLGSALLEPFPANLADFRRSAVALGSGLYPYPSQGDPHGLQFTHLQHDFQHFQAIPERQDQKSSEYREEELIYELL